METVTQQGISIKQFLELNKKHNIQIIDIREKYEYDSGAILKSIHIPMDEILKSIDKIEKEKKVIIYCRSGRRSAAVKYMLEREYELKNICCLEGGYESYLNYQKNKK